ncbi:GIY-YIG nuclease family protein [Mucilaginibacter straminoryzae]|uniref:GIY-YIG nuclease family protein n=1 Tax=Mucilaginibacter straminoryzae TaxID=2932774 RepID=UPI003B84A26C
MPFYTYILQSQKNSRFYVGHTANLDERLNRHNNGFWYHIIKLLEANTRLAFSIPDIFFTVVAY